MQTLSRRDKILLTVMFLVIFGAVALVMSPSGKAGAGKILPLDEAVRQNRETKKKLQDLKADKVKLEPQVVQMTYDMPPEQLSATVTETLYELADKAGVHIREIKPLRARTLTDGTLTTVPLEVRFHALFQPNVMRFLYYAEDPAGKLVVDKISITSPDTHAKGVDVSAQITVYTRSAVKANTTGAGQAGQGDTQ